MFIDSTWKLTKAVCNSDETIEHFYLEKYGFIYDPALKALSIAEEFSAVFKVLEHYEINDVENILYNNPNKILEYFIDKLVLNNLDINEKRKLLNKLIKYLIKSAKNKYEKIKITKDNFYYGQKNHDRSRAYLTEQRVFDVCYSHENFYHPAVTEETKKEMEQIIENLAPFFEFFCNKYDINRGNYCGHSLGDCYLLSILFQIANPTWDLVQGYPKYDKNYKHSWIQKDNVVYDPAMGIVTLANLYYELFLEKGRYKIEETIERTKMHLYDFDYFPEPRYPKSSSNDGERIDFALELMTNISSEPYKYLKKYIVLK